MIKITWLTLNRACNFRCPWCYAESTEYLNEKNMSFELAKELVDFTKSLGAKKVFLIGGEPTYYFKFFELLEYIKLKDMKVTLVTNGFRFHDKNFIEKIKGLVEYIGFSIKAANPEQHKQLTRTNTFEHVLKAMRNLHEFKKYFKIGYSTVISKNTLDNMEEFAQMVASTSPGSMLNYTFCNPSVSVKSIGDEHVIPREILTRKIVSKFPEICKILNDRVNLTQSIPKCAWPEGFIEELNSKGQANFKCHLMNRSGLIFDTDGKLITCNSLMDFPIAEYKKDFNDKESFEKFWNSEKTTEIYKKFYEYPEMKCIKCKDWDMCGGGCPLKWFVKKEEKN